MTEHVHKWVIDFKLGYIFCFQCADRLHQDDAETRLDEYETLNNTNADLLEALERHIKMFEMVCDKVDFRTAFLDAKTIAEWNDASIQATEAIRKAEEKS